MTRPQARILELSAELQVSRERIAALEAQNAELRKQLAAYEGPEAPRGLSTYAFNEYGGDAKLYNGILDLEANNQRLTRELRVEVCNRKAADAKLNELTRNLDDFAGVARPYAEQIECLFAELLELRADRERLDWLERECVGIDFDDDRWTKYFPATLREKIDAARKAGA